MKKRIWKLCEQYCQMNITLEEELLHSKILSSYDLFELICELETEFKIEFSREELSEMENWSSVASMIKLLKSKGIE